MTGEQIRTPRGSFSVTDMTAEQMREAGYGLHHTSEDGKYLIMGNGTQAFAVAAEQPEKVNPLKHVEDAIGQNDNNFDGIINNTPTPTADELEAKARSGEQISLAEYAAALKADAPCQCASLIHTHAAPLLPRRQAAARSHGLSHSPLPPAQRTVSSEKENCSASMP